MGIARTVRRPRQRSVGRTLSGVLAGGRGALALVLVAGWYYADRTGLPGPGLGMIVGHGVAAVVAGVAQVRVDRNPDRAGTLVAAALAALIVGGLALAWLF